MKLLDFLARRLGPEIPQAQLHRWIRTGQVRVNGGRSKPFARLAEGDAVRVPPFAVPLRSEGGAEGPEPVPGQEFGNGLRLVALTEELLVLDKDSGLAVQPGSGQTDSVAQRLADFFAGAAYVPAPAHRLDKETSGLLLAGRTHAAQRRLHGLLGQDREAGESEGLIKEYLAWVPGRWPWTEPVTLEDNLEKRTAATGSRAGKERVEVVADGGGQKALAIASACRVAESMSLLRVRLVTGRTHQIRVQLASRGFPLFGDRKYGGPQAPRLMLHACGLALPGGRAFRSLPSWPAPFSIKESDFTQER